MSWFEEWFDSPLYEKLYVNRNEKEASMLANLIEKELPVNQYTKVLDLGCGRGRHSLSLAKRGYMVTGTDLSDQAIKKAQMKASQEDLENITFHVRDMRDPLTEKFDAILNLFTTFGYFLDDHENVRVFKSVHKMLEEYGVFLIDYMNAQFVRKNLVPRESGNYEGISYDIERFIREGMVFKKIHFTGDKLSKPIEYQERVKLYELKWFRSKLRDCGFSMLKTYGDYRGSQFDPVNSRRLLMIAAKTGSENR
jgi:cyclopropane fatty-acyl-phospholipid synthase-like methyltransferase